MIVLSGHFKKLIFYKIFDVLSSKFNGDHCRSLYINTSSLSSIVYYFLSIDRYRFELTQLVTEIPLFVRPVFIIIIIISLITTTTTGIVCLRFHRRTSGLGNSNVCAAIVPFFSITFVSVCKLSPLCAINVCIPTTALKFCSYLNH